MLERRLLLLAASAALVAIALQGCVAALPVMLAAGTAAEGFLMFKTAQSLTGGGKVKVGFGEKGEKNHAAPPLVRARRVGIWPGSAGEVPMAEKLASSPNLVVSTPNQIQQSILRSNVGANLAALTVAEQEAAFLAICRSSGLDQIYMALESGGQANMGFLTVGRANTTAVYNLQVFDCRLRRIVWRDRMTVAVDMVGARSADPAEVLRVVGGTWADWMLQAPQAPGASPEASQAPPPPPTLAAGAPSTPSEKPTKARPRSKKPAKGRARAA